MGTLPAMTQAERKARNEEKQQQILSFLAAESWTDIKTAGMLLGANPKSVSRLLLAMCNEGLLIREQIDAGLSSTCIYGITATGIVRCDLADVTTASEHQLGRLRGANLPHHTRVQQLRIRAERAGWSNWQPGKQYYGSGLPVVPDAVAIDPGGVKTAIELERNSKSAKRRAEVLAGHVMCIVAGHWQRVQYIADDRTKADRLQALYLSLATIKTSAGETEFNDSHRKRFRFCNFNEFAKGK